MTRYTIPGGVIIFALIAFWMTTRFDRVPPILVRGMQPEHFPQLILGLIILLCVLVMLFDTPKVVGRVTARTWASMGLFGVFALVAQVDFFLGLAIFALLLTLLWGERRPWALLIVGIVTPLCVFFLFDQVFEVRFPRGLLTNLWYG